MHTAGLDCIDLIKHWEACNVRSYQDDHGIWTIGYGCTTYADGHPVLPDQTISADTALELLHFHIERTEDAINRLVTSKLKQSQFDALVCFVYNIGIEAFKESTMLSLLNEQQYLKAALEFPRWSKLQGKDSRGLLRRRVDEMKLFLED